MTSATSPTPAFQPGDTVAHPTKPEWGTGTVIKAEGVTHEGERAQRLTVRFARAGLKTLSTAFAKLQPAGEARIKGAINPLREPESATSAPATPKTRVPGGGRDKSEAPPPNPFEQIDPEKARAIMAQLPEPATDPFASLEARIVQTLALYRHTPEGGRLIEWASAQSGLVDPLGAFNRHELEAFFDKYRVTRDQHLVDLLKQAHRARLEIAGLLPRVPKDAQVEARVALRRHGGVR